MEKNTQSLEITSKLARLNLDMGLLGNYNSLSSWVGEFGDLSKIKSTLKDNKNSMIIAEEGSKKGIGAVFCKKESSEEVQAIISDSDYEAISIPESEGSAKNILGDLKKEDERLNSSIESLQNEINDWNTENVS